MASQKLFWCCALLIIFFFFFFFFMSTSQASSNGSAEAEAVSANSLASDEKISLSLYYEALCPYCANFIVNNLIKVFTLRDLSSIINLRLIPWGNAIVKDHNTWVCQHGPDECLLNTVEACAINAWPDLATHFRFIRCVERLHLENKHTQWQSCFATERLDPKPIADCYNHGLGFKIGLSYADETARLNPSHEYVPWVVVNGRPLKEDYQNFVAYVCKSYKGPNVPEACRPPLTAVVNSSQEGDSVGQVCYAGEAKNSTSVAALRERRNHRMRIHPQTTGGR